MNPNREFDTARHPVPEGWPAPPAPFTADFILSHVSERSVLHDPDAPALEPFVVAGRRRLATCSGVAWFRGYHLAVVNLYGRHLRIYRFHPEGEGAAGTAPRVELLHELSEGISFPEDVTVSADGSLLAISHSLSRVIGVTLHSIDPETLEPRVAPVPLRSGYAFHSVKFSPDSRHLAFTEVAKPGYVEVVSVSDGRIGRSCLLENRDGWLKPKSIAFSHDSRFVFLTKTLNITTRVEERQSGGQLSVHAYDSGQGVIEAEPVAVAQGTDLALGNIEICRVLPRVGDESYRVLLANQGGDVVSAFEFDASEHTLTYSGLFARGLSFPHGLDVSDDGKYVAVTNYGDDTLRIARITGTSPVHGTSTAG